MSVSAKRMNLRPALASRERAKLEVRVKEKAKQAVEKAKEKERRAELGPSVDARARDVEILQL